ncbi:MAG: hypothetical protein FWE40_07585 [Oscillospiraceae bacterium]|jgi:hypothetical protein|nr:hypothetical protein [Oscillospiraceae bacterium]
MKLIAILLVLVLLAGCGSAAVVNVDYDYETTTEYTTTTEITTTAEAVTEAAVLSVVSTAANLHWEEINLHAPEHAQLHDTLMNLPNPWAENMDRISETLSLQWRHRGGEASDLWLINESNGVETLLIEGSYDPEDTWHSSVSPFVHEILSERFFLYGFSGLQHLSVRGVFDLQRMQSIPIDVPDSPNTLDVFTRRGDTFYFHNGSCGHCCRNGHQRVHSLTLNNLERATRFRASENLLATVPQAYFPNCFGYTLVSPNGKYYVVREDGWENFEIVLHFFNLREQAYIGTLTVENTPGFRLHFSDENTLVVFGEREALAMQITLP